MRVRVFILLAMVLAFGQSCKQEPRPEQEANDPHAGMVAVTGTVNAGTSMNLPPDANVSVELIDLNEANPVNKLVARHLFQVGAQAMPLPFEVFYRPEAIVEDHQYGLKANIQFAGRIVFTMDNPQLVLGGYPTQDVELLVRPATKADDPRRLTGQVVYPPDYPVMRGDSVIIQLVDLSQEPPQVLQQRGLPTAPNFPSMSFGLTYDPYQISPDGIYALRAELRSGNRVMLLSDGPVEVINNNLTEGIALKMLKK